MKSYPKVIRVYATDQNMKQSFGGIYRSQFRWWLCADIGYNFKQGHMTSLSRPMPSSRLSGVYSYLC